MQPALLQPFAKFSVSLHNKAYFGGSANWLNCLEKPNRGAQNTKASFSANTCISSIWARATEMRRSFREKTRYRNSLKSLQIKETFRLYDFWKGNFDLNGGIPYGYIESKYLPRLFGYSTNLASSAEELLSISQMTFFFADFDFTT